jgi:hypothetical protein
MTKIQKPIKIKIKGAQAGYEAGEWCRDNIDIDHWDLWMDNVGFAIYTFEFKRKQDATIFALRWAEYG